MNPLRGWLSRIAVMFRKREGEREFTAELESNLQLHVDDNLRRGLSPAEARRQALISLGGVEAAKEAHRDQRGGYWLEAFVQDVRFALRMLRKSPGFTVVAILTLALGIGANTAIFTAIDGIMLKSLPVRDPRHLFLLHWNAHTRPKTHGYQSYGDCASADWQNLTNGCSLSKPFLEDVRKLGVFSGIAEFAGGGFLTLSGNGPASQAKNQFVSGDYFETLGVRPALGRLFVPSDDAPGAAAVAVLHYDYWQNAFGGDPSVIGRVIHLNRLPFTVIGVAEQGFTYFTPGMSRDLWVPMVQRQFLRERWSPQQEDAASWWIVAVGRLKPGVSRLDAQNRISALFANEVIHGEKPILTAEDAPSIALLPAQDAMTGVRKEVSRMLFTLMLAVGIVLLVACANVAGLLLARSAGRRREIAVRLALGAGRTRLLRQLLTESLTLSAAGGVLGVLLAQWSARALMAFASSDSPRPLGISLQLDWRVLGFTLAATVLTAILFGLVPAMRAMRIPLTSAMKEGAGGRAAHGRFSVGDGLVVAQVALTVVVLVGAGLLVRTLRNLRNVDPGFATNSLLTFQVDTALTGYTGEGLVQLYEDLRARFAAVPGVLSASYSEELLLAGWLSITDFHLDGTPPKQKSEADWLPIGPDYFATMKIPLLSGRAFLPEEYSTAAKIAADSKVQAQLAMATIVNESFVRAYFPHVNPVGQRFGADSPEQSGDPETEKTAGYFIVGVAGDSKYNDLRREIKPAMYSPAGQGGAFELRTAGDPLLVMPAVREIIRQSGNDIPITDVKTQTQRIDDRLLQERLIARLSSFFGLLALLLACIGLHGLLAYEVTRSTREIGIRMALGAQARDVLRGIVARGLSLAFLGALIGSAAAIGVTRFLGTMLYGVKPDDAATFIAISVILLLVAFVACYLPARRATRVDPLVALRYE